MSVEPLRQKAQEIWTANFTDGPYSNLIQADYLISKSSHTYSDILKAPKTLTTAVPNAALQDDNSIAFKRTWATAAGRCTAFCIRIVRRLQEYDSPAFDFKFYDLRGHRVARCMKTGILIDSSSAVGVLVLKDGADWVRLEEEESNPKWKWDGGESKFKTERGLKVSAEPLTVQQCMTQCLSEVRDRFEPLCLFRSFSNNHAHFHGMLKWVPAKHHLVLIQDLATKKTTTITFDRAKGTTSTEKACKDAVTHFISQYGGPEGEKQWKFGQVDHRAVDVHEKIWETAKALWGFPYISQQQF
ncbi:hypothetical protein TWF481_006397 [Arthrobotrys musiformis]|uniref:Fungal-type protein kinase domain-containing protein n=1 Tax=Arthrobotrys musiformis TaxID=47236 RepID=A0AAV9WIK0_9PEZI